MPENGDPVVLISGAAGGLGVPTVEAFLSAGWSVVAADRDDAALRRAFGDSTRLHLIAADMTDDADVRRAVQKASARKGRLQAVVNLAGGFASAPLEDTTPELWDRMINLNARTALLLTRHALAAMSGQGGAIINIAAQTGLKGGVGTAAYSASKAAVMRITESAAAEGRDKGVRCNCILPGVMDTPGNRRAMPNADRSRWVDPAQVARAIVWLCSDDAAAVTGAAIPMEAVGRK